MQTATDPNTSISPLLLLIFFVQSINTLRLCDNIGGQLKVAARPYHRPSKNSLVERRNGWRHATSNYSSPGGVTHQQDSCRRGVAKAQGGSEDVLIFNARLYTDLLLL